MTMILLYSLFICTFWIILLPYFILIFSGNERLERFGFYALRYDDSIWIHAASVGEVNAIKPLIIKLLKEYPTKQFIITTMTKTGNRMAQAIDKRIDVYYLPFDCYFLMRRVFARLNPSLIIIAETEFWPNMLCHAEKRSVPVILVNGRISQRSFPKYKKLTFFFAPLWKAIQKVNAQSELDKQRFVELGFEKVVDAGNLKFAIELPELDSDEIRRELGFTDADFVLCLGSSRPGEEKLIRNIYNDLRTEIPNLKLIVAPRHLKRLDEVRAIFKTHRLYSEKGKSADILIVDTMGKLTMMYAACDIAIVGGSFFDFGGHNPLEAAYYRKPIIIGPYHQSCLDSVNKLNAADAVLVANNNELKQKIAYLFDNSPIRSTMGSNAKSILEQYSLSVKVNLDVVRNYIRS